MGSCPSMPISGDYKKIPVEVKSLKIGYEPINIFKLIGFDNENVSADDFKSRVQERLGKLTDDKHKVCKEILNEGASLVDYRGSTRFDAYKKYLKVRMRKEKFSPENAIPEDKFVETCDEIEKTSITAFGFSTENMGAIILHNPINPFNFINVPETADQATITKRIDELLNILNEVNKELKVEKNPVKEVGITCRTGLEELEKIVNKGELENLKKYIDARSKEKTLYPQKSLTDEEFKNYCLQDVIKPKNFVKSILTPPPPTPIPPPIQEAPAPVPPPEPAPAPAASVSESLKPAPEPVQSVSEEELAKRKETINKIREELKLKFKSPIKPSKPLEKAPESSVETPVEKVSKQSKGTEELQSFLKNQADEQKRRNKEKRRSDFEKKQKEEAAKRLGDIFKSSDESENDVDIFSKPNRNDARENPPSLPKPTVVKKPSSKKSKKGVLPPKLMKQVTRRAKSYKKGGSKTYRKKKTPRTK